MFRESEVTRGNDSQLLNYKRSQSARLDKRTGIELFFHRVTLVPVVACSVHQVQSKTDRWHKAATGPAAGYQRDNKISLSAWIFQWSVRARGFFSARIIRLRLFLFVEFFSFFFTRHTSRHAVVPPVKWEGVEPVIRPLSLAATLSLRVPWLWSPCSPLRSCPRYGARVRGKVWSPRGYQVPRGTGRQ